MVAAVVVVWIVLSILVGLTTAPLRRPSGMAPLRRPSGMAPLRRPSGMAPLRRPTGMAPLRRPSGMHPSSLQSPSPRSVRR
jgi:hypothetical protein